MSRRNSDEVKKVGDLFEKYRKTLKPPEKSVVLSFCEVVEDVIGFRLTSDMVSYSPSTRTITLRGKAPLRTEIKLHKEELLNHLRGRLGVQNAPREII